MTTVYDMASGTEYRDEELSSPKAVVVRTPVTPRSSNDCQVELRLGLIEPTPSKTAASIYPAGLDIKDLFDKIGD